MKKSFAKSGLALLLSLTFLIPILDIVGTVPTKAASTPSLIITELCVNSAHTATDTKDAYEYIELKNTGASSVNLLNYKLKLYTADDNPVTGTTASALRTWTLPSKTLAAGGIMVVWLQTTDTPDKTLAAFNSHYGTSIPDSGIILLDLGTAGLGNTGYRKLVLQNTAGAVVSYAKYNEGTSDDANANYDTVNANDTTIVYEYRANPIPTYKAMYKVASMQKPTPGMVPNPPSLWITELMVNPTTSSGDTSDSYEYIELYNNTASAVNLGGYKFRYYATTSTYYTWDLPSGETITIPAYGYKAIWVYSPFSEGKTAADFNAHYNVSLPSNELYVLDTGDYNLANTSPHSVALYTDGDSLVCKASYNQADNTDASFQNRSILYERPLDGSANMRLVAVNQDPTPCELYSLLFGQLHGHSTASDGSGAAWATDSAGDGSPAEAYPAVKAVGADFFALTDHSHYFDSSGDDRWTILDQTSYAANENNVFSAFAGYEMTWNETNGWWGHMNTFNTSWVNSIDYGASISSLPADFTMLANDPESISQFNHPVEKWGTFNDYANYSAQADGVIPLIEATPTLNGYIRALDRGWHVAPSRNNDTHSQQWYVNDDGDPSTTGDKMRTVVLAPRATKDEIFDAIRNRRVYASQDTNLRIRYTVNGVVMGSRLTNPGTLNLKIDARDPDAADTISTVSVVSSYGTVVYSQVFTTNVAELSLQLSPQYSYYFVRVDEADGDWAATAPVWITDAAPVAVTMELAPSATSAPAEVVATVQNTTGSALSGVSVQFYQGSVTSANLVDESTIASLSAGAYATASTAWYPTAGGNYTVYAVVTAGGKKATGKIIVPEMLITELMVNGPNDPGDSGDAYEYIEIYNNTKSDIDLSGYKLRYHFSCNDTESDYTDTDISSSFIVPANGTVLVWVKQSPGADSKTLADFKSFYGLSSFPDSRILTISGGMSNAASRIWYIMKDDNTTIICKAWFNDASDVGLDGGTDGRSTLYKYDVTGLQNMKKLGYAQTPTPGTVVTTGTGKQVP